MDHHRELRRGFPEVIYCAGKTPEQVAEIASRLAARGPRLLGTRATAAHYAAASAAVPGLQYDPAARAMWLDREPERSGRAGVLLLAAGTSDLPVAEEAAVTLDLMGHAPRAAVRRRRGRAAPAARTTCRSCGRRTWSSSSRGWKARCPGVVAGLVAAPVIAVPTSVGYGASFGGLAALLGMLNSCSPGVAVVNIDNGYGAAYLAAVINAGFCRGGVGSEEWGVGSGG